MSRKRMMTEDYWLFLLLIFLMSLNISYSITIIALTLVMAIDVYKKRNVRIYKRDASISRGLYVWSGMVLFLVMLQLFFIPFDFKGLRTYICAMYSVYFGIIICSCLMKSSRSINSLVDALATYNIVYSLVYMMYIAAFGLPEGRSSVWGYVSSNYSACTLYLSYPLFLYYLINMKGKQLKKRKQFIVISMFVSLLVIFSTGSRTAIGVVLLIFSSFLFVKKTTKQVVKTISAVLIVLLGLVVLYYNVPSVQLLLIRALQVLNGTSVVKADSRTLVWRVALDIFNKSNRWIGTGSNIVVYEGTPEISPFELPCHNLALEILLLCGFIGLLLYISFHITVTIRVFRNSTYEKRLFIILLTLVFIIIAAFQPFFSTSYLCGFIFWMSMISICNSQGTKYA